MSLENKNVVLTGGGSGIGAATAKALADAGANVLIAGQNPEKLNDVCKYNPERIRTTVADVADRGSVQHFLEQTAEKLGQVDILINAAGINVPRRMMHNLDPHDWDKMMAINATGAFNCMRAFLPQMRERKDGVIINISSISGIRA